MTSPVEFHPTPADLVTAEWRTKVDAKLDHLIAAFDAYQEKANGRAEKHSQRLDAFGLALARQEGQKADIERLKSENRVINILLAVATGLGSWFGIRLGGR